MVDEEEEEKLVEEEEIQIEIVSTPVPAATKRVEAARKTSAAANPSASGEDPERKRTRQESAIPSTRTATMRFRTAKTNSPIRKARTTRTTRSTATRMTCRSIPGKNSFLPRFRPRPLPMLIRSRGDQAIPSGSLQYPRLLLSPRLNFVIYITTF